jgi:hypothetical protein
MKKLLIVACFLIMPSLTFAAQGGPLGVGIILGDPTGLSAKYWLDKKNAIDAAIGFDRFSVHADYLFHFWNIIPQTGGGELGAYLGPGFVFKDKKEDNVVGIRFALGAAYELNQYPVEIFAEIVPVFELAPDTDLNFDGGIGVRYFF